jgi:hypothetical protein
MDRPLDEIFEGAEVLDPLIPFPRIDGVHKVQHRMAAESLQHTTNTSDRHLDGVYYTVLALTYFVHFDG